MSNSSKSLRLVLIHLCKIEEEKAEEICKSCDSFDDFLAKRQEMVIVHQLTREQQLHIINYVRLVKHAEQEAACQKEMDKIAPEHGQEPEEFDFEAFYEKNKAKIEQIFKDWSDEEIKCAYKEAFNRYYYKPSLPLAITASFVVPVLAQILPRLSVLARAFPTVFRGLLNSSDEIFRFAADVTMGGSISLNFIGAGAFFALLTGWSIGKNVYLLNRKENAITRRQFLVSCFWLD